MPDNKPLTEPIKPIIPFSGDPSILGQLTIAAAIVYFAEVLFYLDRKHDD